MAGALKLGRLEDGIAFAVDGRGTFNDSRLLDQLAGAYREQYPEARIVVDLSRCVSLDSTFLGCLVKHGRSGQLRLTILVTEQGGQKLFGSSRLDRILPLEIGSVEPVGPWTTLACGEDDRDQLGRHVLETHRCLAALDVPGAASFRSIADRVARELDGD